MEGVIKKSCEKLLLVNELRLDDVWRGVVKEYSQIEKTLLSEALVEYHMYGKLSEEKSTDEFRMKMGYILSEYCCMARLSEVLGYICEIDSLIDEVSSLECGWGYTHEKMP